MIVTDGFSPSLHQDHVPECHKMAKISAQTHNPTTSSTRLVSAESFSHYTGPLTQIHVSAPFCIGCLGLIV